VDLAVTAYTDLLKSLTDEQFEEIMKFVESNSTDSKYLIYSKK
jgi:hypothetical protein